ncbi:hypothetical protein [Polymorphobacter multimanifer]|nr:hypothetical protein [Polymorphobacter multimanifer]
MDIQEVKVLLSPDQYGRVAIVRRSDGRFCLYQHWHWTRETQVAFHVEPVEDRRWTVDSTTEMYEGVEPLSRLYGTVEDAERQARRMLGLNDG